MTSAAFSDGQRKAPSFLIDNLLRKTSEKDSPKMSSSYSSPSFAPSASLSDGRLYGINQRHLDLAHLHDGPRFYQPLPPHFFPVPSLPFPYLPAASVQDVRSFMQSCMARMEPAVSSPYGTCRIHLYIISIYFSLLNRILNSKLGETPSLFLKPLRILVTTSVQNL